MKNNQEEILRLNRLLRTIRSVNQLLIREKNTNRLLKGICQILIKNRSYYSVWITIIDETKKLLASAQAGLGKEFSDILKLLKSGNLPDCVHRSLSQPSVVVIENPEAFCPDCPLAKYYRGRGGMSIRIAHDQRIFGVLCASTPKNIIVEPEEKELLEEFAGDLAFALHTIEIESGHKNAIQLLQEAEKRYRSVFENTGAATLLIEEDMTISMVNTRFEQLSGYSRREVEGKMKLTEFVMDVDKKRLEGYHIKRRKQGEDVPTEYEFFFKDNTGARKNIFCKIGIIPGTKRSIASWVDISSLKEAEESLRKSEKRFRELVENSPIGISIIQTGHVIYRNPEQKRLLGSLPLSTNLLEYENIHPEDIDEIKNLYRQLSSGEVRSIAANFRFFPPGNIKNDNEMKWIYCQANTFEYQGKEAILVNVMDTTKAKELERLLLNQDKMASLGRVATGIAHEIRNPLTAVNMYLEVLNTILNEQGGMEKGEETIKKLQSASNKIESVIRRVMDFSKPSELRFELRDINLPIEETIELTSVTLRKNDIKIEKSLAEGLPLCKIDPHLIEEVLLNLINNAAEAMRDSKRSKKIKVSSSREGDFVLIKIADSGPGVPMEYRSKVFEPFYTTKRDSTGIGLSLVHRIILDHGGYIAVDTSFWKGAEFKIRIPIAKQ